jgi:hypothetical protein
MADGFKELRRVITRQFPFLEQRCPSIAYNIASVIPDTIRHCVMIYKAWPGD